MTADEALAIVGPELEAQIKAQADADPPFTEAQRAQLAALFCAPPEDLEVPSPRDAA